MKIIEHTYLDYDDVLIRPKSSAMPSRQVIELGRTFTSKHSKTPLGCLPIFASNMDTTGTFSMAKSLADRSWLTCLHKHYTVDQLVDYYKDAITRNEIAAWYSMGLTEDEFDKFKSFMHKLMNVCGSARWYKPNICVDVANLYSDALIDKLEQVRKMSQQSWIMAGNVATPEMVERIIRQGQVDIVKVGIGPGKACTTRLVTGVGVPMLSSVLECADAAHGSSGGYICADGGCQHPGDVCKAFGANADFVMVGGMLAGCDECEGEWEYEYKLGGGEWESEAYVKRAEGITILSKDRLEKRKVSLKFYGMSSHTAQERHNNGIKDYRASEGRVIQVPYKGPAETVMKDVEGGIRSCCTYIGAKRLKDMGKCTTFMKVNRVHNNMER